MAGLQNLNFDRMCVKFLKLAALTLGIVLIMGCSQKLKSDELPNNDCVDILHDGKTAVFNSCYNLMLNIPQLSKKIDLTTADLESIDQIANSRLTNALINDDRVKWSKLPENLDDVYSQSRRQVLGFKGQSGDEYALVQMLDMDDKSCRREFEEQWYSQFIVGVGGTFERCTVRFLFNLSNRSVTLY